jgi:hypothetical protein
LNDQQCEISEIDGEKVLECLHKYMVSQYDNLRISFNEMYKEGVRTPHFLLNFIDYLYWFEDFKAEKSKLENFEFRYWNSCGCLSPQHDGKRPVCRRFHAGWMHPL